MTDHDQSRVPRAGDGAETTPSSFFRRAVAWITRGFRPRNGDTSIRETIEELIEDREDGEIAINADERLLIGNVFKLRDVSAADVMLPRAEIVAIEASAPKEELVALMAREAHSRVPVYRDTVDHVIGMVHIKDVLARSASDAPFDLAAITRKVLFVSPTIRVLDLLRWWWMNSAESTAW
jgi:CBS domain containing-hemolysin-like protein